MVRSASDPLAAWLRETLDIGVVARQPVGGGCIHRAWRLQDEAGNLLFAKTNQAHLLPLLQAEGEGLKALAEMAPPTLRIPRPLAVGVAGDQAVLVLPWLDLACATGPKRDWEACGADLARLHRRSLQVDHGEGRSSMRFGWERDNFIGASPQPNGWRDRWSVFFADCRLRPQLRWLAEKGKPMEGAACLLKRLPEWLEGHGPQPCLVHGDLWSGNAALLTGGGGCLFDPAVYRGDRETDLAMARLFGGFPEAFFKGYNEEWPLPEGWDGRLNVYNLYHLLNHANLFGGSYRNQAQSVMNALLSLK